MVAGSFRGVYTNPPAKGFYTMRNEGLCPYRKGVTGSVATYRVKKKKDGSVTIQARYQLFKGGGRRIKEVTVPRANAGEAAQGLAEWVQEQRPRPKTG